MHWQFTSLWIRRPNFRLGDKKNWGMLSQYYSPGDTSRRRTVANEEHYIHTASLSGLSEIASGLGRDIREAFRSVQISSEQSESAFSVFPFHAYCQLLEYCAEEWDVPDFGLRVAQNQSIHILGALGVLGRTETTVREGLNLIAENLYTHASALLVIVDEPEDEATASIVIDVLPGNYPIRQYVERVAGIAYSILCHFVGRSGILQEAQFRHNQSGQRLTAERVFQCPVRFMAERNAIYFNKSYLDGPVSNASHSNQSMLQQLLRRTRSLGALSKRELVSIEIARLMERGHCSMSEIAKALGMHERALQRELRELGTSFRELLDEWRRDRSMLLVTQTKIPLSDVSNLLGYSDQSVFTTAFRRWFGQAPGKLRRQQSSLLLSPGDSG